MAVLKPLDYETPIPPYQKAAIDWLKRFKDTGRIRRLLSRLKFSEQEVKLYRQQWSIHLIPKAKIRRKMMWVHGLH